MLAAGPTRSRRYARRIVRRPTTRPWSWRAFVIGAIVGLVAAGLLSLLLKITVALLCIGLVLIVGLAVIAGLGHVPAVWRRR